MSTKYPSAATRMARRTRPDTAGAGGAGAGVSGAAATIAALDPGRLLRLGLGPVERLGRDEDAHQRGLLDAAHAGVGEEADLGPGLVEVELRIHLVEAGAAEGIAAAGL